MNMISEKHGCLVHLTSWLFWHFWGVKVSDNFSSGQKMRFLVPVPYNIHSWPCWWVLTVLGACYCICTVGCNKGFCVWMHLPGFDDAHLSGMIKTQRFVLVIARLLLMLQSLASTYRKCGDDSWNSMSFFNLDKSPAAANQKSVTMTFFSITG